MECRPKNVDESVIVVTRKRRQWQCFNEERVLFQVVYKGEYRVSCRLLVDDIQDDIKSAILPEVKERSRGHRRGDVFDFLKARGLLKHSCGFGTVGAVVVEIQERRHLITILQSGE